MIIPTKKLSNGFQMPVFGLGTWQIGGRMERDPENDDKKDINAIQEAINLGITHIDTAESYADGYSETLVGQAIKDFDRAKLFLVSKIKKTNLKFDDVLKSCQASLKRLGVDYLDLYLIHSPSLEIPIEETMKAMDSLVANGLVRNIGVSNFKTERMIQAQGLTKNKLVVNQVYYNLKFREPEHEGLLKHCQDNDIFLEAYRPLDKGSLLDSIPQVLTDIAKKYDKTPSQVAINWLISQKNVITVAKSSDIQHLKENLGALGWQLAPEDVELLKRDFPDQQNTSDVLPLR